MNTNTLSLVKLAQALCNEGRTPKNAVKYLLVCADTCLALAFLQEADQGQAIQELERRFSGFHVKPWEVQP
jgi:hypothetical protein